MATTIPREHPQPIHRNNTSTEHYDSVHHRSAERNEASLFINAETSSKLVINITNDCIMIVLSFLLNCPKMQVRPTCVDKNGACVCELYVVNYLLLAPTRFASAGNGH